MSEIQRHVAKDRDPYECPQCKKHAAHTDLVGRQLKREHSDILEQLSCETPGCRQKLWLVCTLCARSASGRSRASLVNYNSLYAHLRSNVHKRSVNLSAKDGCKHIDDDQLEELKQRRAMAYTFIPDGTAGEFYRHQIIHQQSGISKLVAQSYFRSGFSFDKDSIRPDEAMVDFAAAHYYSTLTRTQRERNCHINRFYYEMGRRHEKETRDLMAGLRGEDYRRILPPSNIADVNRRYFHGKLAITRCLPMPNIYTTENHAYTSIRECTAELLHRGTPMSLMTLQDLFEPSLSIPGKISWITETQRARKLMVRSLQKSLSLEDKRINVSSEHDMDLFKSSVVGRLHTLGLNCEDVMFLPFIIWTDGVTTCYIKKNSNVWAGSITLGPTKDNFNSMDNTTALVIGREKDLEDNAVDHSHVMGIVNCEIQTIVEGPPSQYYSRAHDRVIHVVMGQFGYFGDQPERRKVTATAALKQSYHTRFRHRAHHKEIFDLLKPCEHCFNLLREGTEPTSCANCCCWDAMDKGPVKPKLATSPSNEYPDPGALEGNPAGIQYLSSDGKIEPVELSYDRLLSSFQLAYQKFVSCEWSDTVTAEFLRTECIEGHAIQKLIANGTRAVTLSDLDGILDPIQREAVRQDYLENPDNYKMPEPNSHWTHGDSISMFVDSPMHLLFLGIVKTVVKSIIEWMKQQGLYSDFVKRADGYNEKLRDLNLEWLPLQDFREGKFGGWVSENYLAFSRIMKWFFQEIRFLVKASDEEGMDVPSVLPNKNWRRCHYVYWLKSRGQTVKKGEVVPDLKERVKALIERPGGPPDEISGAEYEPSQVERTLIALENMLNSVMVSEVVPGVTSKEASLCVKIFLTEYNLLDNQIKADNKEKAILCCPNLLSLMNLPAMLEEFGPLRLLWEGGVHGESFLRLIKPYLRFGLRKNFAENAMRHCMEDSSYRHSYASHTIPAGMTALAPRIPKCLVFDWRSLFTIKRRSVRRYEALGVVEAILTQRNVLSVLIVNRMVGYMKQTLVFVAVKKTGASDELAVHQIKEIMPDSQERCFGDQYLRWGTAMGDSVPVSSLERVLPFPQVEVTFGILLPRIQTSAPPGHTLVCHNRLRI